MGWVNFFLGESQSRLYPHMRAKFGREPTFLSKKVSFKCISRLVVTVHLHKESEKIRIKRGVRQGDTISPKLFTATLESIFRRLNWETQGVKIDGKFLSNIRFADDIFLCTETPQELQQMLQELSKKGDVQALEQLQRQYIRTGNS